MQEKLRSYRLLTVACFDHNKQGLIGLYKITKNPSSKKFLCYVLKDDRTNLHILEPTYFNNSDRIKYLISFLNEYGVPYNKKSKSLTACKEYLFTEYGFTFPKGKFRIKKPLPLQMEWNF